MNLNSLDVGVFLAFFGFVMAFAMFKGRSRPSTTSASSTKWPSHLG